MYLKDWALQVAKGLLIRTPKRIFYFFKFLKEFNRFSNNEKRFEIQFKEIIPCLNDRVTNTPYDHHYIYHPAWAARIINTYKPQVHIDISSILYFSTMLSATIPVHFYDYRPADVHLSNLDCGKIDLKHMHFESGSIHSLSCMHTIEHIGLGRYGDALDNDGDLKAINEIKRVMAVGGNVLFVTPVGKPKILFNGHRIYSYEQIISYFQNFELRNFAMVPDAGGFIDNANPQLVATQNYACGCFWFTKIS